MGINLVAIVENSKGISLEDFKKKLLEDPYGKYAWDEWINDDGSLIQSWDEFKFEGKMYFTWELSPREPPIGLYADSDDEKPEENSKRLLLFKVLLAVERVAGGPVYIGNDVVCLSNPKYAMQKWEFFLPSPLDFYWKNWREVAEKFQVPEGTVFTY
jgi:hypothetical protein